MVAVPLPSGVLPACCSLGKLERLDAAARTKNVTGLSATDGAPAVTAAVPAFAGRRTNVSAWPLASDTTAVLVTCAPGDASKIMVAPEMAVPDESRRATRSESGNSAPGGPVWL